MVRIKTSVASHRRKKRVLKDAKGQFGQRSRRYSQAKRSVIKGLIYEYRDRKVKKREFRRLWIIRINAACAESGIKYSRFIKGLSDANVEINRKAIAELAVSSPSAFKALVKIAKNGAKEAPKKAETKAKPKAKKADFIDAIILIDGIGPKAEEKLAEQGVTKLTQLVKMSAKKIAELEEAIGKPGIVEKEEWIVQAKEMIGGAEPRAKVDKDLVAKMRKEQEASK